MHPIFEASSAFHPALQKGFCGDSWAGVAEVGEMALSPGPGLAFPGTPPDSSQRARGRHWSSLKKSFSKNPIPFSILPSPSCSFWYKILSHHCTASSSSLSRYIVSSWAGPADTLLGTFILCAYCPCSGGTCLSCPPLQVLLIPSWAEPFLSPLDTCIHTHPKSKTSSGTAFTSCEE